MRPVRVEANGAFDHRAAMAVLARHRTEGLEVVDPVGARYRRAIRVGSHDHVIEMTLDPGGVTLRGDAADDVVGVTRHLFDLDADVAAIDAHLGSDALLAPLVRRAPGVRITRGVDVFEAVVLTVLGQQVSLGAARLFGSRLVAAYGDDGPDGLRLFPEPTRLADQPADRLRATLGLTNARTRTLLAVAGLFAGGVRLAPESDPAYARETLAGLPGIGPWTLEFLAMRAFTEPDAFPASDVVLKRALVGLEVSDPRAAAERWRPYRSYASFRLWHAAGRV